MKPLQAGDIGSGSDEEADYSDSDSQETLLPEEREVEEWIVLSEDSVCSSHSIEIVETADP